MKERRPEYQVEHARTYWPARSRTPQPIETKLRRKCSAGTGGERSWLYRRAEQRRFDWGCEPYELGKRIPAGIGEPEIAGCIDCQSVWLLEGRVEPVAIGWRSEEHTSELQSLRHLV